MYKWYYETLKPSSLGMNVSWFVPKHTISFLYANIYYANNQYTWLLDLVRIHNPDVVMFVEYDSWHMQNVSPVLEKKYSYKNRYTGKNKYEWDIIYSRLPVTIFPTKIISGRSYNHICLYSWSIVSKSSCLVDVLLVHTTAPISSTHLRKRNNQLNRLVKDLSIIKKSYKPKTLSLVLGDMNISPWSTAYTVLQSGMNANAQVNVSTRISPWEGTWSFFSMPYLTSHIDHIWTNKPGRIKTIRPIDVPWSDHDWFVFTLSL